MSDVALDPGLRTSEVRALEALRVRFGREMRYPFLAPLELRRLDFLRYYFALRGRPAQPVIGVGAEALGRCVEFYLSGYRGGRTP